MKLIHCSDIHLDSRMESNLSPQQARERNMELCDTFGHLVAYAREEGVAAVLISGDLFDTGRVRSATVRLVLDILAQAPEIDFLYLRGNHDEGGALLEGTSLPKNLKLFTPEWSTHRYGSVAVTGAVLTRENAHSLYDTLSLDPEDMNIVMLHGQDSTQTGEDLVCLPQLKGKNIRYLALGHLHSYREGTLDHWGTWCYSGCLEGRGFDECGEKGFVLLDIDSNRLTSTFVPFAKRTLHEVDVDITGCETVGELRDALQSAAGEIPRKDLVKFVLRGTYTLDSQKDIPLLTAFFRDRWYFSKIKDESTLQLDKASYEHDASLKGEFIRKVMASPLSPEDKETVIRAGLMALSGEEVTL